MLGRGHLDHLGLNAASQEAFDEIRARCVATAPATAPCTTSATAVDWFTDPDGMSGEVCWNRDPSLEGFHAPVPLAGVVT